MAVDLTLEELTDPGRPSRTYCLRADAPRTVKTKYGETRVMPASGVTLVDMARANGSGREYSCAGCLWREEDVVFDRAVDLLHHAVWHADQRGYTVPRTALEALCVQALYDEGFGGEVG